MDKVPREVVAELKHGMQSGVSWLAARLASDGSFIGCEAELVAHYKAPLAFAVTGQVAEGVSCLTYIRHHLRSPSGELASGDGTIKTAFERNQRNFANYMDGWVAIGAWLLGEFGFAQEIVERLAQDQSPHHGGIPTGPAKWAGSKRYDILTNASACRAFLSTGRLENAERCAQFLCAVVRPEHQRDAETVLDMSFSETWDHVEPPMAEERPYYRLDMSTRGERVFCPAFACAVLCEMSLLDRQPEYLSAAERYVRVILSIPEYKDGTLSNGKSGWATGSYGLASGNKDSIVAAHAIVPKVLARQSPDGGFASATGADMPRAQHLETTAEHTAWLAEYIRLAAHGLWRHV